MSSRKNHQEKRKHERYSVKEGVYATVNIDSTKFGQVVNISRGGFAFQYMEESPLGKKNMEKDIFLSSENEYLHNLPFKTVSDIKVIGNGHPMLRQCGIQFGDLTTDQAIQLDSFMWDSITL